MVHNIILNLEALLIPIKMLSVQANQEVEEMQDKHGSPRQKSSPFSFEQQIPCQFFEK